MFFNHVRRNAAKNRKDNGMFFGSLVVAIIAFYTLLSLGSQNVMRFLKTIESDAVRKLLQLIPIVYIISLFFVYFLVYFAYRYQLENRKKELGLYLMFGMRRRTLFAMLMSETLWNSFISTLIGLPLAFLLTEGTSLATAKIVGLGIIAHEFSFSLSALLGTIIGFLSVQLIAMLKLSVAFSRKEPMALISSDAPEKQVPLSAKKGWACFVLGIIFLILAYVIGVTMLSHLISAIYLLVIILGAGGTLLLYRGMGVFIGHSIQKKGMQRSGLYFFTGRQIQENVIYQYKVLAISSLLLLMALGCVSYGVGVASGRGSMDNRTVDFSIDGNEQNVRRVLDSEENKEMIDRYFPLFLGHFGIYSFDDSSDISSEESSGISRDIPITEDYGGVVSWAGLHTALEKQPETELRNNIIENFAETFPPYLISVSSYNDILQAMGKEEIQLEPHQVAMYTNMEDDNNFMDILSAALKLGADIEIYGQDYELLPHLYFDNVVADRKITLYAALIVSDEDYQRWVSHPDTPYCWNVVLKQEVVNEMGLLQAIQKMEQNLVGTGLIYESYLAGIGRNIFYTVSASYLSIYLGVLFMIIANTVIGLKYLMQQRADKHRYMTLLRLGANIKDLSKSARSQIKLFFALSLGVAVCSSVFAIWSMFTSFLKLPSNASVSRVFIISGISAIVFIVIEFVYIYVAQQVSSREIQALRTTDRR